MSEDKGQRREKPTARRLRELREHGQTPVSKEWVKAVVLLVVALYFNFTWDGQWQRFASLFNGLAETILLPFDQALIFFLNDIVNQASALLIPVLLLVVAAVLGASLMQTGWVWSIESIRPKLARIDPVGGFKRMGSNRVLIELLKATLNLALLGLAASWVVVSYGAEWLVTTTLDAQYRLLLGMLEEFALYFILLSTGLALLDWFLQRALFLDENRMSREDIKREFKQTQGDPQIKGRRRRLARELADQPVAELVENAAVIIADRMRLVAVIHFDSQTVPLPLVVAIERGTMARQLLQVANDCLVPVVEDRALATGLAKTQELPAVVGEDWLDPIARILRGGRG